MQCEQMDVLCLYHATSAVYRKESQPNVSSVSKYELRQVAQFADHGSQV